MSAVRSTLEDRLVWKDVQCRHCTPLPPPHSNAQQGEAGDVTPGGRWQQRQTAVAHRRQWDTVMSSPWNLALRAVASHPSAQQGLSLGAKEQPPLPPTSLQGLKPVVTPREGGSWELHCLAHTGTAGFRLHVQDPAGAQDVPSAWLSSAGVPGPHTCSASSQTQGGRRAPSHAPWRRNKERMQVG